MIKCNKCNNYFTLEQVGKCSQRSKGYVDTCKGCLNNYYRNYREKNKEKLKSYFSDYYEENYEKIRNNQSLYGKENRHVKTSLEAKRRAAKMKARPDWLTQDEDDEIKSLYLLCKIYRENTGLDFHVDHIVPLQGYNVCGLHVPWNLQVLSAKENLVKSNKFTLTE